MEQPYSREPRVQAERRIFKDRPDLYGKLTPGMPDAALPAQLIRQEANLRATATRADDAVFPFGPMRYEVVQAVLLVREVNDCFLKGLGFVLAAFHTSILPRNGVLVKYIFTQLWAIRERDVAARKRKGEKVI